jgi:hypothetical protein
MQQLKIEMALKVAYLQEIQFQRTELEHLLFDLATKLKQLKNDQCDL